MQNLIDLVRGTQEFDKTRREEKAQDEIEGG